MQLFELHCTILTHLWDLDSFALILFIEVSPWFSDSLAASPCVYGARCIQCKVSLYKFRRSCVRVPFKGCIKIQSLPSHSVLRLSNIIGREFTSSSNAPFHILLRLDAHSLPFISLVGGVFSVQCSHSHEQHQERRQLFPLAGRWAAIRSFHLTIYFRFEMVKYKQSGQE